MGICWQKVNRMFMIISSAGPSPQDCLHPPWQSALGVTWEVFCWEALRKSNEIKWKGAWIWQSYYSTKFCEPWILNAHHHQPSAQSLQIKHTPKQNLPRTTKSPQELPEGHDKELTVFTWPQNALDLNLMELHGTCLKNEVPWSAVGMKGFALSETMSWWL